MFTIKKFGHFLKALTVELSIFKAKTTSDPEILHIVSCTATEGHRMKKSKFHHLLLASRHPFQVALFDASLQPGFYYII